MCLPPRHVTPDPTLPVDPSTFITLPFVTVSRKGSKLTLWSPFTNTPADPPSRVKVFRTATLITAEESTTPLGPLPRYDVSVCTFPSSHHRRGCSPPPTTFLTVADDRRGLVYALRLSTAHATTAAATDKPVAAVTGFSYVTPFRTLHPIYSWSVVSSPSTDTDELGLFSIDMFCVQSKAVQLLSLVPGVLMGGDANSSGGGGEEGTVVVEELVDETAVVPDTTAAADDEYEVYDEEEDDYDDDDDDDESSSDDSEPKPAGGEDQANSFSNWLGNLAGMQKVIPGRSQIRPDRAANEPQKVPQAAVATPPVVVVKPDTDRGTTGGGNGGKKADLMNVPLPPPPGVTVGPDRSDLMNVPLPSAPTASRNSFAHDTTPTPQQQQQQQQQQQRQRQQPTILDKKNQKRLLSPVELLNANNSNNNNRKQTKAPTNNNNNNSAVATTSFKGAKHSPITPTRIAQPEGKKHHTLSSSGSNTNVAAILTRTKHPSPKPKRKQNKGQQQPQQQQHQQHQHQHQHQQHQQQRQRSITPNHKIEKSISILKKESSTTLAPTTSSSSSSDQSTRNNQTLSLHEIDSAVQKSVSSYFAKHEASMIAQVQKAVQHEIQSTVVPAVCKTVSQTLDESIKTSVQSAVSKKMKGSLVVDADRLAASVSKSLDETVIDSFHETMKGVIVPAYEAGTREMLAQVSKVLDSEPVKKQRREAAAAKKESERMGKQVEALGKTIEVLIQAVAKLTAADEGEGDGGAAGGQRGSSRPSTPGAPPPAPVDPVVALRDRIMALVRAANYESAFTQALSASDSSVAVFACRNSSIDTVLGGQAPLLSQPILLCLMQQLGAQLGQTSGGGGLEVEMAWLQNIAVTLDPEDESISKHVVSVCQQLMENINAKMAQGEPFLKRPLQMLLQVIRGIGNQ